MGKETKQFPILKTSGTGLSFGTERSKELNEKLLGGNGTVKLPEQLILCPNSVGKVPKDFVDQFRFKFVRI